MSIYTETEKGFVMIDEKGEERLISNFTAAISNEVYYIDGKRKELMLRIEGKKKGKKLKPVEVKSADFASMNWVLAAWGSSVLIYPGFGNKDHCRTAIAEFSNPKEEQIYTHTGWLDGMFLHNGGAIRAKKDKAINDERQKVELPPELRHFVLGIDEERTKEAINASLRLLQMGNEESAYIMLAATYAAISGSCDYALHVSGRTGTFKSELASLYQSHFGDGMDARRLPGNWSSTGNALEALAYKAKDTLFVIDDFIPSGTAWQQKAYQKAADQIFRGQGNQAGRARLTDVSKLQETMYPRGLILSTGEDIPDGHSIRGRMVILELAPDEIDTAKLTAAQDSRDLLPLCMGAYIGHCSKFFNDFQQMIKEDQREIRKNFVGMGHARTPAAIAHLIASFNAFVLWAEYMGAITSQEKSRLRLAMLDHATDVAKRQIRYIETADPVKAFGEVLRLMFQSHVGHIRTKDGGIPRKAEILGWSAKESFGDVPTYSAHGKKLGWIDWVENEIDIDVPTCYPDIKKHSAGQITFTRQTMVKRLKDAGLLVRVDENRQRNTVRVQCEGHPRQVVVLNATDLLELGDAVEI